MRSVFGPARYLVSGIKSFVNLRGVQGFLTIEAPKHRDHEVCSREREFFIDNLLARIHFIIEVIWWTGLAPWEFPHPKGKDLRVQGYLTMEAPKHRDHEVRSTLPSSPHVQP